MTKMNKYCPRVNCVARVASNNLVREPLAHSLVGHVSSISDWIDTLFEAHL